MTTKPLLLLLSDFIRILIGLLSVIIALAYLTLAERKIMASIQRRVGPNSVGIYGILQPIMDGVKLVLKEDLMPNKANSIIFILAPVLNLSIALLIWCIIPINSYRYIDLNYDLLWWLGISSIGIMTVLWSGWSSNSKYSMIGSLRSTAQMISYEIIIGIIVIIFIIIGEGVPNLGNLIEKQNSLVNAFSLFSIMIIWLISIVAETNRHPFDLPEAESELVSGFNTEYGAAQFALWFISEYGNMVLMSVLTVDLFLGGNMLGVPFIIYYYISIRAAYPRYRYSDLISICWESLLPIVLGLLVIVSSLIIL